MHMEIPQKRVEWWQRLRRRSLINSSEEFSQAQLAGDMFGVGDDVILKLLLPPSFQLLLSPYLPMRKSSWDVKIDKVKTFLC